MTEEVKAYVTYNDPRYQTLVLQGEFGSVGYTLDPTTGELERCCICSAWNEHECTCGFWDIDSKLDEHNCTCGMFSNVS